MSISKQFQWWGVYGNLCAAVYTYGYLYVCSMTLDAFIYSYFAFKVPLFFNLLFPIVHITLHTQFGFPRGFISCRISFVQVDQFHIKCWFLCKMLCKQFAVNETFCLLDASKFAFFCSFPYIRNTIVFMYVDIHFLWT